MNTSIHSGWHFTDERVRDSRINGVDMLAKLRTYDDTLVQEHGFMLPSSMANGTWQSRWEKSIRMTSAPPVGDEHGSGIT
jgi:hypothetical protein